MYLPIRSERNLNGTCNLNEQLDKQVSQTQIVCVMKMILKLEKKWNYCHD